MAVKARPGLLGSRSRSLREPASSVHLDLDIQYAKSRIPLHLDLLRGGEEYKGVISTLMNGYIAPRWRAEAERRGMGVMAHGHPEHESCWVGRRYKYNKGSGGIIISFYQIKSQDLQYPRRLPFEYHPAPNLHT